MSYPAKELIAHYRLMVTIREFEEALDDLFSQGLITGTAHFCRGQEACAVGAVAALEASDLVTSNHRGHGHFIAKGAEPGRLMAELMGKRAGYSGGRGGSQHMAAFDLGFLGSNGITAGMIPIATGAAMTQKLKQTGRVVLCFFGDGACAQGAFHEAINMGALWELPIVYFLENNLYAMSTHVGENFKITELVQFADAYGLAGVSVDGNDYFAVRATVTEAVSLARSGAGPTLIEARTYRMCGHSKSDDCEYRSDEEERTWAARDPLLVMKSRLIADSIMDEATAAAAEQRAADDVATAIEFARQASEPDPDTLTEGLFAASYLKAR